MLARLNDYARSIGTEEHASMAADGKLLPDVNTMIERLAARLETTPGDIEGWRTLGWSYFHTARYEQAATAFAKAVELDPSSAELKRSYEEAKAKASGSDRMQARRQGWRRTKRRENYQVRSDASARARRCNPIDGRWPGKSPREFSARRRGLDSPYALSSCAW